MLYLKGKGSKNAANKKATIPAGSCDLSQRIFNIMEKHKEVRIILRLICSYIVVCA